VIDARHQPLWRLLLEWAHPAPDPDTPRVLLLDVTAAQGWRTDLDRQLDGADPIACAFIVYERRGWRALRVWGHRDRAPVRAPTFRAVTSVLTERGLVVRERFGVWPDVTSPRLAFPSRARRALRWLQRTGTLGGGGQRLWVRAALRVMPPARVLGALTPGVALLVERDESAAG
jgi:hypothetical protein